MKIKMMPVSKIIPYARNPRKNDGLPVAKTKASLQEFGWQQPIVIDAQNIIIVGHTRFKAAIELGMTEVPCHIAANLTPAQVKAYRIADNKTGEFSEWDMDLLVLEFEDLKIEGFDLDLTGFAPEEVAGMECGDDPQESVPDSSSKEIDPEDYQMGCRCPRCGFEFDDKQA